MKLIFALFFLVSCGTVTIKNQEWCADFGEFGASCVNTLNDKTRDIEKEAWDKERVGMMCTKSSNFADTKATILQLCEVAKGKCIFDSSSNTITFWNSGKYKTVVRFFNDVEKIEMKLVKMKKEGLL
jgi:hypothetical protein